MLLNVENLHVSYGNIKALHGISFSIDAGEIVTIIGANGAGKSTTLRAVSRMVPVEAGSAMTCMGKNLLEFLLHGVGASLRFYAAGTEGAFMQRTIEDLAPGAEATVDYELARKDVEAVTVRVEYLGEQTDYPVFLEKEATQDLPTISCNQYDRQGQLGIGQNSPGLIGGQIITGFFTYGKVQGADAARVFIGCIHTILLLVAMGQLKVYSRLHVVRHNCPLVDWWRNGHG